jgi:hypothetical protein
VALFQGFSTKVFAERQSEQLPNFARERALNLYCTLLRAEKCNLVAFGIAIGTYLKVMAVLGMESNFAEMAAHDEVGIKLQNIKLLEGSK